MKTNPNVFRALRGEKKDLLSYLEHETATYNYKLTERYDMVLTGMYETETYEEETYETYSIRIEFLDKETNTLHYVENVYPPNSYPITAYRVVPYVKEAIRKYENKLYPTETTEYKSYKKKIITKEIKEAIEYFNGFWEGDNITITADFLDFAETLKELL
jgi:hypothetical protein